MAKTFDPYYKWLAIPPKDQPPNHYRLLGVERFEQDLDVIESAADQRMAHVRSFQSGQNSAVSQKILNELAAARVCLLNVEQKARYDAELRAADATEQAGRHEEKKQAGRLLYGGLAIGIGASLALAAAVAVVFLRGRGNERVANVPLAEQSGDGSTDARPPKNSAKTVEKSKPDDKASSSATGDDGHIDIVVSPTVKLRLVRVPATLDGRVRPFYLGESEVTEEQWAALMGGPATTSRLPKVFVKLGDCREFLEKLNELPSAANGLLRLPARDEFIHALGELTAYDEELAWVRENSPEQVREAATRKANARGLFDLLGNVWEFADDGKFYGMSSWDRLEHRWLAYASIPLPLDWTAALADWQGGNLGFRVAASEANGRREPSGDSVIESGSAATDALARAARPLAEDQPAVLGRIFAEPLSPPDVPGVSAEQIVIWNQHHGAANDRGTLGYNLRLFSQGKEVWKHDALELMWAADRDISALESPPPLRFDRLRLEMTRFHELGGGLAEVEVFRGASNLARGCPAAGPALDPRFPARAVTDGMIGQSPTQPEGYWLSPPGAASAVEVDLAFAEPRPCNGIVADRVVVHNQHNGAANDRGTTRFHLALISNGREVWRQENIDLPWQADEDGQAVVDLPDLPFDRARIEVAEWRGLGGGLSEVEIWQGERNLARDCPVMASSSHLQSLRANNVTDGIASSQRGGYWLLPDNMSGWIEIDLACHDQSIGETNGRLGAVRCVVEDNWPLGLAWLARSSHDGLRSLAVRDLADAAGADELAALGDGWWEIAAAVSGKSKERLQARALYRYARALPHLPSDAQVRVRQRTAEALPELPERNDLYFHEETEADLLHVPGNQLRDWQVMVGGRPSPYGLWMHPPPSGAARARFALGGKYHRLRGAVGINDTAQSAPASAMTFRIVADSQTLWTSQPLSDRGSSETFDVEISGVDSLELSCSIDGPSDWCHAVWVDPRLE